MIQKVSCESLTCCNCNAAASRFTDMLVDNSQRGYSPSLFDCMVSIPANAIFCQAGWQLFSATMIATPSYLCDNPARQSSHICKIHRIGIDKARSSCFDNIVQITQIFNNKNAMICTILILWHMLFSTSYACKIHANN